MFSEIIEEVTSMIDSEDAVEDVTESVETAEDAEDDEDGQTDDIKPQNRDKV